MNRDLDAIFTALDEKYPDAGCSLDYKKDYELLFSTRLAAQCTDKRVNIVAAELYGRYPSLETIAAAEIAELEAIVRPCGFYRHKAADIKAAAIMLLERYGGKVPDTMEELLTLPGIGRKTANLILSDIYGKPAIVADTHCIRLSNLIGLVSTADPYKVELALRAIIPPERQSRFCHQLVLHGRAVCIARRPDCPHCIIAPHCDYAASVTP